MYLTFLAQKIFILKSDMYDSLLKMGTLSVHLKIYFKNEYKIT